MYEQSYTFSFEAAHYLPAEQSSDSGAQNEAYRRLHGHSFVATVTLRAETLADDKWVVDFAALRAACEAIKSQLDHRILNESPGLETPTLERLAQWIFVALQGRFDAVARVEIARPTLNERVAYSAE